MTVRAIQSDTEYRAALSEIATLMEGDPEPGTPEGVRLDGLVTMVQSYEVLHMSMEVHGVVNKIEQGK